MAYLVEPIAAKEGVFGARCPKCGHVSYFNKQEVCPLDSAVEREIIHHGDADLDGLYLNCRACGVNLIVPVDCRGYK
jgi:hypothetical protein